MKNKAIQQLLEIQEAYNENGDIEQVKNSIKNYLLKCKNYLMK